MPGTHVGHTGKGQRVAARASGRRWLGRVVLGVAVAMATPGMAQGQRLEESSESGVRSTPALEAAAETLEPRSRELWPDSFAGLWVDVSETGVYYSISVAFTRGAGDKVAQLARGFPEPSLLRPMTFEYSMRELERRQREMGKDRELARAGDLVLGGVRGHCFDLGIDVRRNALVVVLERASPEAVETFKSRYGRDVLVQEGPLAVPEHTDTECGHATPRSAV